MSQQAQQTQPLRLRNPTPYHLMATQQQHYNTSSAPHPLADISSQHTLNQQQQPTYGLHNSRDSPASEQIEFNDSFSQNVINSISTPLQEYQEDHDFNNSNHMYDNRGSFSSASGHPLNGLSLDAHRRSSVATDATLQSFQGRHPHPQAGQHHDSAYNAQQQPMYIPGNSFEPAHSLAMSAPANMGYEYDYAAGNANHAQVVNGVPLDTGSVHNSVPGSNNNTNTARSFEDDYTAQMNMQLMMEKRRRRRESHNAVERRRRDNINDRIQELCSLLPEAALENANLGPNNKPNKGAILRKSVDHIRQLHQEVQTYHQRVEDLEKTLQMYRQDSEKQQQQQRENSR